MRRFILITSLAVERASWSNFYHFTVIAFSSSFSTLRLVPFAGDECDTCLLIKNWNLILRRLQFSVKLAGAWWSVFGRAHRVSSVGLLLLQRFRFGLLLSTRLVSSRRWILINMFAVSIHWWVEVLHADRTTSMCIWTTAEPRVRWLLRKTGLSLLVMYYWLFQGDVSVVVYSNCQCLPAFGLSLTYCSIYVG